MKKGILLSTATAMTLLFASPGMSSAESNQTTIKPIIKYEVHSQIPQETINEMIQQLLQQLSEQYNIKLDIPTQPSTEEQSNNTPIEEAPVVQPPTSAPTQPEKPQEEQPQQESSALSQFELQVVELTNAERAKSGLPALKIDESLSKVARTKSADMQSNKYFDHNSPTYGSPFDMMKKFGITYKSAGENIAYGQKTPQEVVNAWMNSDGHRKNILNSSFTHIGVGYVEQGNYWTQMFIGK
ncbi:CAP domain-containing protein [Bacillus sp. SCS-151]|uniref:CAP domain-containing protein n=1 Tax=Nanhaiella sioensis TaxID=3115293 RepID=UPI00397B6F02